MNEGWSALRGRSTVPEVLMALYIFQSAETSVREKHRQAQSASDCTARGFPPAGEFHEATANGLLSTILIFIENRRPKATPGRVSHRGNVSPATPGRVDGPAACTARRGPDGVRGVVDFCDPAKIRDIPGLPTGDILPAGDRPTKNLSADDEQPDARRKLEIKKDDLQVKLTFWSSSFQLVRTD